MLIERIISVLRSLIISIEDDCFCFCLYNAFYKKNVILNIKNNISSKNVIS